MFPRLIKHLTTSRFCQKANVRTFLSSAYHCEEVWQQRLNNAILKKVNLDDMYFELDQRFQKTRQISAVDVDIFANTINHDEYLQELMDIAHKLRCTADTMNTLDSTHHAVVRLFLKYNKKEDLLQMLDDRCNYGIFLDYYTANILMDTFWKQKDFTSGAKIASQLMLQEEFDHPISFNMSLLHCYKYLTQPGDWSLPPPPEEPEEEVKIRVRYVRNPYDDDHFDLRDPKKIVGKTLAMFTTNKTDTLSKSLNILGLILYDKPEKAKQTLKECQKENIKLHSEIIDLIPEDCDIKPEIKSLATESTSIEEILLKYTEKAVQSAMEKDISNQCLLFSKWEDDRHKALQEQIERLSIAKRVAHIEEIKQNIKEKETKLWFFENQEKIELDIESSELSKPTEEPTKKKMKSKDEEYIPPEI